MSPTRIIRQKFASSATAGTTPIHKKRGSMSRFTQIFIRGDGLTLDDAEELGNEILGACVAEGYPLGNYFGPGRDDDEGMVIFVEDEAVAVSLAENPFSGPV